MHDLTRLEDELDQIEPLFIKIRDKRNKLLQNIASHETFLAPIQRIPPETLLEIFKIASSPLIDGDTPLPWILGHVCSSWRSISRSFSTLWRRIRILGTECPNVDFLTFYLSLSRDQPVEIIFENVTANAMNAFRCIVAYSSRWSTLEISIKSYDLSEFSSLVSVPPTQLKRLMITIEDVHGDGPTLPRLGCSNPFTSSRITSAVFRYLTHSQLPIPLEELDMFSTCTNASSEILSILQQAQKLTNLCLQPVRHPLGVTLPTNAYPSITHPFLRELCFTVLLQHEPRHTCIHNVFDYVSLPALNSFSVVPSNPYVYNSIALTPMEEARLVGLFHRSDCNLTSLTLSIPFAVDTFLIPILIQSLTLQYLDVKVDTQMAGGVFRSLSSEAEYAPNLRDLHIEEFVGYSGSTSGILGESAAFHAMILSRWKEPRVLENLSVDLLWEAFRIPPESVPRFLDLLRLKEEGLEVSFQINDADCLLGDMRNKFFGSP